MDHPVRTAHRVEERGELRVREHHADPGVGDVDRELGSLEVESVADIEDDLAEALAGLDDLTAISDAALAGHSVA